MKSGFTLLSFILFRFLSSAQAIDTAVLAQKTNAVQTIEAISTKSLDQLNDKYSKLTNAVELQSEKLIKRMQEQEQKLKKKLQTVDSSKAKELFSYSTEKYQELQEKLKSTIDKTSANPLTEYIPGLDSIATFTKFFTQQGVNIPGFPTEKLEQIQALSSQVQALQSKLQQANNIQSFIKEREAHLKAALANTSLSKQLTGYNKQVFYYQQQITEYKEMLHDKKKMEEKLLSTVRDLPAFKGFMQKHSYLAQLFKMPENYDAAQVLSGLQTRAFVQQGLQERLGNNLPGAGGINPDQYMQQQIGVAQSQMNILKDKINKLGGSSSDMEMPDFHPNAQKTKSFFKRLEYGFDVQSEKGRYLLPVTSDIALSVGYKLNDKSVLGFGAAYKIGWGSGWNNIQVTSEGVGLRSYVDIKAKGSVWLTGGFEYNYWERFADFSDIKNLDVWQKSALVGITKKYKIGKKEGKIQVLYDFFAAQQAPLAPAFKFRTGWNF